MAAAGTHPALQVAISSVESSSDLQRFYWQLGQQLEGHKASLEALAEEQRRQASVEAQEQHEELLGELRRLATQVPERQADSPRRSRSVDIEALVDHLQQQQQRVEEMQELLQSGLDRAAPSIHLVEKLEVLYARHEARLDAMLVQNEKVMEEYLQQVRQTSKGNGKLSRTNSSLLRGNSQIMGVPTPSTMATPSTPANIKDSAGGSSPHSIKEATTASVNMDRFVSLGKTAGQTRRRIGDCQLDTTSLCAVQGWRSWVDHGGSGSGRVRIRANAESRLSACKRTCSEASLETFSTVLVVANLIFMGIDTNVALKYRENNDDPPAWLWGVNIMFLSLLVGELCMRVSLERWRFIFGANWRWNLFDLGIVLLQGVDMLLSLINSSFLRVFRVLRLMRTFRSFKTMSSVRELRVMLGSISHSLMSLLWAFLLLFMTLYAAALVLAQSMLSFVQQAGDKLDGKHKDELFQYYGSIEKTMLSLFMAVSNGENWGDLVKPLSQISQVWTAVYVLFVIATVFGMLNVLTAIFVESTTKVSARDHELVIQEHLEANGSTAQQLRKLLSDADTDQSGYITVKEFEVKLKDSRFLAQLSALELDIFEAHGLFQILKYDEGKGVPIEDFIYGLMRMKGTAKGVDMVTLLSENRRILSKLLLFMEFTDDTFQDFRASLHIPGEYTLQDYLEAQ